MKNLEREKYAKKKKTYMRSAYMETEEWSDGDGVGDGGIDDGGGMSHDTAALHVAEAVD